MKITFFKNENHFSARTSYCWENAELAEPKIKSNIIRVLLILVGLSALLAYTWIFRHELSYNIWLFVTIIIVLLPIHELCHAIFCFITKRKIERICFFSSFSLNEPIAYVMPEFSAWSKIERALFYLFPTIILSVIPTIIAIFLPLARLWLLIIALFNVLLSSFDISDAIKTMSLPRKCIVLEGFALMPLNKQAIVIHKIFIQGREGEICHKQYIYEKKRLSEVLDLTETEEVKKLENEIKNQSNLEK